MKDFMTTEEKSCSDKNVSSSWATQRLFYINIYPRRNPNSKFASFWSDPKTDRRETMLSKNDERFNGYIRHILQCVPTHIWITLNNYENTNYNLRDTCFSKPLIVYQTQQSTAEVLRQVQWPERGDDTDMRGYAEEHGKHTPNLWMKLALVPPRSW